MLNAAWEKSDFIQKEKLKSYFAQHQQKQRAEKINEK